MESKGPAQKRVARDQCVAVEETQQFGKSGYGWTKTGDRLTHSGTASGTDLPVLVAWDCVSLARPCSGFKSKSLPQDL
jgi:hypothetical protein